MSVFVGGRHRRQSLERGDRRVNTVIVVENVTGLVVRPGEQPQSVNTGRIVVREGDRGRRAR
jgi:hypothetical protein